MVEGMGIRSRWHAHRLAVLLAMLTALAAACGGAKEQPSRGNPKYEQFMKDSTELEKASNSLHNKLEKIKEHQMFVDEHGSNFEVFFNPSTFRQIIRNLRTDFDGEEWHLLYAAEMEVIEKHKKLLAQIGPNEFNPTLEDSKLNDVKDDTEQAILNYDILIANKLTENALAGVHHLSKRTPSKGGKNIPGRGAMMYGTLHGMLLQLQAVADEIGFEHTLGATRTSIATLQSLEDNFRAAYGVDITASKAKQRKQMREQRKDVKSGAGLRKGPGRNKKGNQALPGRR